MFHRYLATRFGVSCSERYVAQNLRHGRREKESERQRKRIVEASGDIERIVRHCACALLLPRKRQC